MTGFDTDVLLDRLQDLVGSYRDTLQFNRRRLLDHFTLTDVAHKVVGVGSVGTRAWVLLFEGGAESDVLLLQAKQAERSALTGYAGDGEWADQGERVVTGQRLMQASSDIFLGWLRAQPTEGREQDYYVRQLSGLEDVGRDRTNAPPGAWRCTPGCVAGRSRAPTPDPVTGSRSRPISASRLRSTMRSPSSPRPTPTRTRLTTPRSRRPSPTDASRPSSACERTL